MKNLGRVLILLSIHSILFGSVFLHVDRASVMQGDSISVRFEVFGKDITPPAIDSLCGVEIEGQSTQRSVQIINGSVTKNYNLIYKITPENNCTIEPVAFTVDGKVEKTKPLSIEVTTQPKQTKDANYSLVLYSSKKTLFVGESFDVVLEFRQKRGSNAIDSKFYPPKLDGFWIKEQSQPTTKQQGEYSVTKIHYKLSAQREGKLKIFPAKIKIALRQTTRDYWNSFAPSIKWKTYYSNAINVDVFAPPKGIKLVGNFAISLDFDKTTIHRGEPFNIVVQVKGDGNIEDIGTLEPYIDGVNIFAQKPKVNQEKSLYTQKLTFVADKDFRIEPFRLHFFNPATKKIENIQTKPLNVEVIGAATKKNLVIQKQASSSVMPKNSDNTIESSYAITWALLSFVAGLFTGGVILFLFMYKNKKTKKTKNLSLKDPKVLFVKLLPYKEEKEVASMLELLEESLYGGKDLTIEKSQIKHLLKKYSIT